MLRDATRRDAFGVNAHYLFNISLILVWGDSHEIINHNNQVFKSEQKTIQFNKFCF